MLLLKKARELLTQKYFSPISVLGNHPDGTQHSIFDTDNGTLFTVSTDSLYTFRDKDANVWSTIPEYFTFNKKRYYPTLGTQYILTDGLKYSFVSPEMVVSMAAAYFEKFADENYGIKKKVTYMLFLYGGAQFITEHYQFKSKIHDKIDAYISNN